MCRGGEMTVRMCERREVEGWGWMECSQVHSARTLQEQSCWERKFVLHVVGRWTVLCHVPFSFSLSCRYSSSSSLLSPHSIYKSVVLEENYSVSAYAVGADSSILTF